MITKEEFIDLVANNVLFDGETEYKQVVALAKDEGLRLSRDQVWTIVNEARNTGLITVDW